MTRRAREPPATVRWCRRSPPQTAGSGPGPEHVCLVICSGRVLDTHVGALHLSLKPILPSVHLVSGQPLSFEELTSVPVSNFHGDNNWFIGGAVPKCGCPLSLGSQGSRGTHPARRLTGITRDSFLKVSFSISFQIPLHFQRPSRTEAPGVPSPELAGFVLFLFLASDFSFRNPAFPASHPAPHPYADTAASPLPVPPVWAVSKAVCCWRGSQDFLLVTWRVGWAGAHGRKGTNEVHVASFLSLGHCWWI